MYLSTSHLHEDGAYLPIFTLKIIKEKPGDEEGTAISRSRITHVVELISAEFVEFRAHSSCTQGGDIRTLS